MFQSLKYFLQVHVLRKNRLRARVPELHAEFNIAAYDVVGRTIFKNGMYEPNITNYFLQKVEMRDTDVFIDIGANIGWYSVLVDKHQSSCGKILSFEPDRINYELFSGNIKLNGCKKITAENVALSAEKGRQKLYRYSDRNLGRHSLLPINDHDGIEIETVVLDDYWNENIDSHYFPRLIKIDTEGYEYQVLKGAKKLMERCPEIMAEFSPHFMRNAGIDPSEFIDYMFDSGYSPHIFSGSDILLVDKVFLASIQKNENILWRKNNYYEK